MLGKNDLSSHPLKVLAISPGIAIGPVRLSKVVSSAASGEIIKINPEQVETELKRLHAALDTAVHELGELSAQLAQTLGRGEADIFEAQQLMLQDPDLLNEIEERITQQHYAAVSAIQQVAEEQAQELASLENELLAARAADIRDATARAIRHLQGVVTPSKDTNSSPFLLVANDLTPSDTATFDPHMILGICTVVGGPTTHAAIIARALEIPAIAGLDPQILDSIHDGQYIAIDGTQGLLYLQLNDEQQHTLETTMRQQQAERNTRRLREETRWRDQPARTADGVAVQVFANVGDAASARQAAEQGAEGIGLLRTEFLFGGREVFPDEEEQYKSYLELFKAFSDHTSFGKTIVARTLDAGADKPFPALEPLIGLLQEANPALGLRGVRIHLVHEELLHQQLRALLRAGAAAEITLHIMFPMIATLEEVRRVRSIYTSVRQQLQAEGVPLPEDTQVGIMVETPAAAVMADILAKEVDFFSIGANDLFQYTMAVDRTNSRVTSMFGTLEPAVWRLIAQVAEAGKRYGKTVALCGELAADPRIAPLLAGLGVHELSMSPPAIVRIKGILNEQPLTYWQQRAQELLKADTATAILNMI